MSKDIIHCVFEKREDGKCHCVRGGCTRKVAYNRDCDRLKARCRGTGPSPIQKVVNVAKATAKHVATGMVVVSKEVEDRRASICQGCNLYASKDGGKTHYCSHMSCGCGVDSVNNYLSKLKWESEKCPHPKGNKWEMTDEALANVGHPDKE